MKKIAILGCGQLGSIVADAVASGLLPAVETIKHMTA